MSSDDQRLLNTVYIISKGRPECHTARTLERIEYPGEWFIVCQDDDETLGEYRERWGDHVLTFDWHEQIKTLDTMDNFGFEKMPSGACPVRNATAEISRQRGERRHWQFDDDYVGFARYTPSTGKNKGFKKGEGDEFRRMMLALARYAERGRFENVGFCVSTIEASPGGRYNFGRRVFNAHNLPSAGELFTPWRARMNDDLINALDSWRLGRPEIQCKYMSLSMLFSQKEEGGLTDFYKQTGTVRKVAYAVMTAPSEVRLVIKYGRYHHTVSWEKWCQKIVSDKYRRDA